MTPLDTEIERVRTAVRRADVELSAMERLAEGACCPSCLFGEPYNALAAAQERRLAWLAVLLLKRAGPGDARLAGSIKCDAWP